MAKKAGTIERGTTSELGAALVKDETVDVVFKNTYVGDLGVFYKKNKYAVTKRLAEMLKDDIEG
jgi:hypothetical protein